MQINGLVWDAAVSTKGDTQVNGPEASRRHPLVIALAVLVFAECALRVVATIYLGVELLVASPSS